MPEDPSIVARVEKASFGLVIAGGKLQDVLAVASPTVLFILSPGDAFLTRNFVDHEEITNSIFVCR